MFARASRLVGGAGRARPAMVQFSTAPAPSAGVVAAAAPAVAPAPARVYGGLKDEDRIFTNLYGRHDWGIKGAMKRVSSM